MAIKPFRGGNTCGHASYAKAYWCTLEATFLIETRQYRGVDTDSASWVICTRHSSLALALASIDVTRSESVRIHMQDVPQPNTLCTV